MSTSENLSDAISAASLVLAVVAALYTLWLPDVAAALALTARTDPEDRKPQRAQVNATLLGKSLPLFIGTGAAAAILTPRGLAILREAWKHHAEWEFDDVKAFFVLTFCLMLLLAVVALAQIYKLWRKRHEVRTS